MTFPKIGPCSIVFERIRGVNRYYLTINLDGEPFKKYGLNAVSDARNNVVGIDLGTQTIALSFRETPFWYALAYLEMYLSSRILCRIFF